jgi:transposase-like protein
VKPIKLDKTYESLVKPHLADITHLRDEGYNVAQISKFLGISQVSFYHWMRMHEEFYNAWEEGQTKLVAKLEEAAAKKALGHKYEETEETTLYDADGEVYGSKKVKKTKVSLPDSRLIMQLLSVLHPKKYKKELEVTDNEIKVVLSNELDKLAE